ncbi:Carboxypeptidase C (cathepsin A) (Kex1) (PDB:1AC5) [Commensalibacter communis]|uniref:S10 family peptidase n=1 Tax=Commensalibacter communis TaxID=2972786 RepID=UPI0022FF7856|nr:peptidase S10 [Commensalibacter communis]CAI3953955.1 Carboxypeptidase C (cathepsin A) (Kex1) (PDB:1AC5) [Commensalibacter communis]
MKKLFFTSCLTSALILSLNLNSFAQTISKSSLKNTPYVENTDTQTAQNRFALLPQDTITHHKLTLADQTIPYTAHAGTLFIRNDKAEITAKLFFVAYTMNNVKDSNRPISFFFNGGPGAGSSFLNLGAAGPEVINFPQNNPTDGAHAIREANKDSWLPFTDMVFIDAVDTGYSLSADPDKAPKDFYTSKQDAKTFAKVIQLYLSKSDRKDPPVWLVGESYGGLRSILVANDLQKNQNIFVRGIIMISPAIEMGFLDQSDNPMANAFILPSYIASHLEKTQQLTDNKIKEAYNYAMNDYLAKIINPIPTSDQQNFYQELSQKTGLPTEIIAQHKAVLDPSAHDIRSRDGKLHSLYDYTLTINDPYPDGTNNEDSPEPVLSGFGKAYGGMFATYAAQELKFQTPLTYNLLNMPLNSKWSYTDNGFSIVRGMPILRKLMALNPSMKLFIAHGYFDLVCPFASSQWIINQMPINQNRINLKLYKGGHMLYANPNSRAALTHDVQQLYLQDQPAEK